MGVIKSRHIGDKIAIYVSDTYMEDERLARPLATLSIFENGDISAKFQPRQICELYDFLGGLLHADERLKEEYEQYKELTNLIHK